MAGSTFEFLNNKKPQKHRNMMNKNIKKIFKILNKKSVQFKYSWRLRFIHITHSYVRLRKDSSFIIHLISAEILFFGLKNEFLLFECLQNCAKWAWNEPDCNLSLLWNFFCENYFFYYSIKSDVNELNFSHYNSFNRFDFFQYFRQILSVDPFNSFPAEFNDVFSKNLWRLIMILSIRLMSYTCRVHFKVYSYTIFFFKNWWPFRSLMKMEKTSIMIHKRGLNRFVRCCFCNLKSLPINHFCIINLKCFLRTGDQYNSNFNLID